MSANFPQYWYSDPLGEGEWQIDPETGQFVWVPGQLPSSEQMGPGGFDAYFADRSGNEMFGSPNQTDNDVLRSKYSLGQGVVAGTTNPVSGYNRQEEFNRQSKRNRMNIRPEEAQQAYMAYQDGSIGNTPGAPLLESAVLADMEATGYRSTQTHGLPTYTILKKSEDGTGWVTEVRAPNPDGGYSTTEQYVGVQPTDLKPGVNISYDNRPLPESPPPMDDVAVPGGPTVTGAGSWGVPSAAYEAAGAAADLPQVPKPPAEDEQLWTGNPPGYQYYKHWIENKGVGY